ETTALTRTSSYDNAENLAATFFSEIVRAYEGTALGRQELNGEIIDAVAGALWSHNLIETARISAAPALDRIVVAVDPPATAGPDADECGIVVAGATQINGAATGFVLADRSVGGLSPRGWAERAVAAYHEFEADRLVVEVNQGGDMVRTVIAQVDPSVAIREVRASRGKRLRAEPVAALYERMRVRHVGAFPVLEAQMTSFTGEGGTSPDRLDALVWALSDLLLRTPSRPSVKSLN
ncbi:MAG: ATP-binding protein, partial [Pseudomonadota bacterium]